MFQCVKVLARKACRFVSNIVGGDQLPTEPVYFRIISEAEVETLRQHCSRGRTHPLLNLIARKEERSWYVVEHAARMIYQHNQTWFEGLKDRLLATDDYTHASSAIGEIRAYGALLDTWMTVTPGPKVPYSKVSPEFGVDNGDGDVIVEVHTRQLDNAEAEGLKQHHADLSAAHRKAVAAARSTGSTKNVVTSGEKEVFPTGAPKPGKKGDTWVTNTISRIAAIKEKEHQIDPELPFVLWLDLHDYSVWGFALDLEFFRPLFSEGKEGYVNSGPFWFALYGKKGDPLLYSQSFDYRSMSLAHDGRFFQTMTKSHGGPTRVSAVVFSTVGATMVMENPNAIHPLPKRVRAALMKVPDFRLDLSIMEWEPGLVSSTVEQDRKVVVAAATTLGKFDAAG
jgi:hypothetical protein